MGDRFYEQQKKTRRVRLKKDIVAEINNLLAHPVEGLDKLTKISLEQLLNALLMEDKRG